MARESFKPTPGARNYMQNLPASADDLPEETLIDLDAKDGKFIVVDDTPEADRGKPAAGDRSLSDQEDDLRGLSKNVQKRIDRIRFETHTERRAREAAERERDAAIEFARTQQAEVERLRKSQETGATALASSMKSEREARLADAQRRLEQAHADGDNSAIAKATSDIAGAQAELVQIAARTPAPRTEQAPVAPVQPQRQQAPVIEPNVAAWISHNDRWFNKDRNKTEFAMSLHKAITARGIPTNSDEYTAELDKGLKAVYPDHVPYGTSSDGRTGGEDEGGFTPRRTNGVTEGSREGAEGQPSPSDRTVKLTRSEVSLAQKMRIPLERYAAEKQRRLQAEKGGAR